jgi:hypothetical protein
MLLSPTEAKSVPRSNLQKGIRRFQLQALDANGFAHRVAAVFHNLHGQPPGKAGLGRSHARADFGQHPWNELVQEGPHFDDDDDDDGTAMELEWKHDPFSSSIVGLIERIYSSWFHERPFLIRKCS